MSKPIYFVGGGKGGVGKSLVAIALTDYLVHRAGETVLVLETDTSNPDVAPCFEDDPGVRVEYANLDRDEGWMRFANLCERHPDAAVVVNTAARNHAGVAEHGYILDAALAELGRELVVLWVINAERDGLQLLTAFMEAMPGRPVHVLRNLKHGAEASFDLYNGSRLRETVEAAGGTSANVPKLAADVAKGLFSDRLSVAAALRAMPIGNRAALTGWRQRCAVAFERVVRHGDVVELV